MEDTCNPSLLLSLLLRFSTARYWKWIDALGPAKKIITSSVDQLTQLEPRARKQLQQYQGQGANSDLAQLAKKIVEQVNRQDAEIIDHNDNHYPLLLKQIHRPPPLLFIKGNLHLLSMPQIAIVGSRHATKTGLRNSYDFARCLAEHGFSITSGLAIGIDGAAHQGALAVEGKSIAVMATGIDSVYPKGHRTLADQIIDKGGVLVTEFFPGVGVRPRNFPQRNRIISGLCAGVLVVEATLKSGSLITARCALEQDREVFAIPGSIHNPQAAGTHSLIKQGAHLVENANDIVEQIQSFLCSYGQNINTQLPLSESYDSKERGSKKQRQPLTSKKEPSANKKGTPTKKREPCSEKELLLLEHMGFDPANIDQLAARTGLSAADISTLLISLELKDYIHASAWGYEKNIL